MFLFLSEKVQCTVGTALQLYIPNRNHSGYLLRCDIVLLFQAQLSLQPFLCQQRAGIYQPAGLSP